MSAYVDPQVAAFLEMVGGGLAALQGAGPPDIELARTAMGSQHAMYEAIARPMAKVLDLDIPGDAGPVTCRVWSPRDPAPGESLPVLLYFSGGTFTFTSLDDLPAGLLSLYAAEGDCIVVVPNHRKPPENRFPGAFDDCTATYRWLHDHADQIGGDKLRIAVMGESSGGTLAAAVCQDAKRLGLRQPVMQAMFEPLLDVLSETPSINTYTALIDRKMLDWGSSLYFGDDWPDRVPRRASPLRAEDVSGLAYAYIVTAEFDPLRDQGHAYAMRLRGAGVPVSYLCYDGQVHGFMGFPIFVREAMVANHQFLGALRLAFAQPAAPA